MAGASRGIGLARAFAAEGAKCAGKKGLRVGAAAPGSTG